MRMPHEASSSETILNSLGEYHAARLDADPVTRQLGGQFQPVQEELRRRNDAERTAARQEIRLMAQRDFADWDLDNAVRQVHLEVLKRCNNRQDTPDYRKYLPDGLTAIVGAALPAELQQVKALEERLRPASQSDQTMKQLLQALTTKRTALEQAIDKFRTAVTDHATAQGLEEVAQLEWRRQYRRSFGALTEMFPSDKSRVEGYFKRAEAEEAQAATQTTPAQGTA